MQRKNSSKISASSSKPADWRLTKNGAIRSLRFSFHPIVGWSTDIRDVGLRPNAPIAHHSLIVTSIPRETALANADTLQLVMRMQPLDSVLPTLVGVGVPWMP